MNKKTPPHTTQSPTTSHCIKRIFRLCATLGMWGWLGVCSTVSLPAWAKTEASPRPHVMQLAQQTSTDPADLERQLQGLEWEQFRQVVYSIPKLKSGVDAYGPLGWEFVRANYRQYAWQKKIAKLSDEERGRLAHLIQEARQGRQLGQG